MLEIGVIIIYYGATVNMQFFYIQFIGDNTNLGVSKQRFFPPFFSYQPRF